MLSYCSNYISAMLLVIVYANMGSVLGQNCTSNEIRLNTANGYFNVAKGAGRVEICYCDNTGCSWATITAQDNAWSWPNTQVACRQLGYITSQNPILGGFVPLSSHASDTVTIYPSTFNCNGAENRLSQCAQAAVSTGVSHIDDSYIQCYTNRIPDRSVRLRESTAGSSTVSGVVEVYWGSSWVTICPSQWDDNDADVVCRELGYEGGSATTTAHGSTTANAILGAVDCVGTELSFGLCAYEQVSHCNFLSWASVECKTSGLGDGSVRLFSVGETLQRVEVLYAGRWGSVCNARWSKLDGEVVCRELGYDLNFIQTGTSNGAITGLHPIWVGQYDCSGDESTISSCATPFAIGYAPGCTHANDAGLYCGTSTAPTSKPSGGLSGGGIAGITAGVWFVLSCFGAILRYRAMKKQREARQQRELEQVPATGAAHDSITPTLPTITPPSAELTAQAPPSYNEAIYTHSVAQPPEYSEKEQESAFTYSDPAYPPPAPSAPARPNWSSIGYYEPPRAW